MKKVLFTLFLVSLSMAFFAQTVTLTFTGRSNNNNQYVQLDRVVIYNLTQNWQETLLWPDTVLTMTTTGIDDVETQNPASLQLSQNNPNPFNGTTYANLTVAESGNVTIEITDIAGRVVGTNHFTSQSGIHQLRVTLSTAGVYFLTAKMNGQVSSIKMVNQGEGGTDAIEHTEFVEMNRLSIPQKNQSTSKGSTTNPFQSGDQMEYVGYATIHGTEVESEHVTQTLNDSQVITLQFEISPAGQPCPGMATFMDIDSNVYNTVQIGNQCWMRENLRTTRYANGGVIPFSTYASASSASTASYRYAPDENESNVSTYGYLYNWRAVMNGASSSNANPSGVQGVCPNGWHVPSDAEWAQLLNHVLSQGYECISSTEHPDPNLAKALAADYGWELYNEEECAVGNNLTANNVTGFSALPAGFCAYADHTNFGHTTYFWTASKFNDYSAIYYCLNHNVADVWSSAWDAYSNLPGYSVRCVRN